MKRKIIIAIILTIMIFLLHYKMTNNNTKVEDTTNTEKTEVDELKEQYNITGNSDIYNVEIESDGRKVINIKASVNFKVAFAGMIKNAIPSYEQLDSIFEENAPIEKGIWIKKEDREMIVTYLNESEKLNCKYEINNEGYLQIEETNNANTTDKKIENLINGEKQYIFCISSVSYMVDTVTGDIIDNPYNELEKYQTYDYFKDEDRMIIFITENKDSKMTESEIFESIIDLIDIYNY